MNKAKAKELDRLQVDQNIAYCKYMLGRLDEFERTMDSADTVVGADLDADRRCYLDKIDALLKLRERL